jgi:replicative DNA helicase
MLKVGEKVDLLKTNPEAATGIPTGFIELDRMTNGLSKGDLVIVAGRPSMGKTTFAMNVAEHVAIDQKKAVAVFSLEMSAEQIAFRVASSYGRIDQQRMRTGQLDDSDWDKLVSVINLVDEAPMYLVEVGGLSPMELRSRARKINARHGPLGLIVIDYIQLMQTESSENRVNAVSEISRSLKALARELNVPVIALSQLNRGVDARDNKRPRMSDLRESGAIEQDADIILFIYRDEVYNKDTEDKGIAEIIIGKQRNGPTGMVKAAFMGQYTRFDNLASQSYDY